jgi:two-component system chemotaxis sensor kinase CheA
LDSFDIDMELLRRIGNIRRALEELDFEEPSSPTVLDSALRQVWERLGDGHPELQKLLDLLGWAFTHAEDEQRRGDSSLVIGITAAVEAAEQSLFADDEADAGALLKQAGATLLLAMERDPAEWESWTREESPESQSPPTPSLDDLAAYLIRMDPEEKGAAARLRDMARELQEAETLPGDLQPLMAECVTVLEEVTIPQRTSRSVRKEAVDRVAELLEEASLLQEEMEEGDPEALPSEPNEHEEGQKDPKRADEDAVAGQDALELEDVEDGGDEEGAVEAPNDVPSSEELPEGMDQTLLADFVAEGFEYLEQAEEALLSLETDPDDPEAINVVFRAFHTIKGVSGFLELHRISELSHHAETLLSKVRDRELTYSGSVADLSLRTIDVLTALLEGVRSAAEDGVLRITPDFHPLFRVLSDPDLPDKIQEGEVDGLPGSEAEGDEVEGDDEPEAGNEASGKQTAPGRKGRKTGADTSVRVRTDRLDSLVDMVGELVIAHSMLAQDPTIVKDRGHLSRKVDHTNKILRELQDLSTSLRMVPLKPAFQKVARTVRDLSRKIGKPVRLVSEGEDTEIDRTMVDVLADPLVHMVRNSLDHGLESPEEREEVDKPREGLVKIKAYQAGGNVVIEVSDDGRGLNRDKILSKALERGVVESDRGLTDQEIYNLIFAAGFSTAASVTEVSGRGVGMDVVRRNVESLRGRVTIDSEPGEGSTFSIHLPLTLAITDGMVVRVGDQEYIIPSVKIQTSFRPDAQAVSTVSGKGEMVRLHEQLLPMIRLHALWGIPEAETDPTRGLLVIAGEGTQRSAILVDEMVTQQQFVVKPLTGIVAETQGVAGGTIMGDGSVGLILDPEEIVALARGNKGSAAA